MLCIPNELKEKEKLEIIEGGIKEKIEKEKNIFNLITLFGMDNIIKLIKLCPGLTYDSLINKIFGIFGNYILGGPKKNNDITSIIKIIDKKINLYESFIHLIREENESQLLYLFGIINIENKLFFYSFHYI